MFKKDNSIVIEISAGSMLRMLFFLLVLFFIYLIRDIIIIFIVALLLAAVLEPLVSWLNNHKIPRALGVLVVYLFSLFGVITLIILLVPPIIEQLQDMVQHFPQYWSYVHNLFPSIMGEQSNGVLKELQDNLLKFSSNIAQTTTKSVFSSIVSLFGGVVTFFVILVITYYFLTQEDPLKKVIRSILPDSYQPYTVKLLGRMQQKIALWLRGQLLISLIIFLIVFIMLKILSVPNALVLSFLAGILETIPILGPTVAAIPAILMALSQSFFTALLVLIGYVLIQQIENHILVPKIMSQAVGLNPIMVILAVLIGAKIAGIIGLLLAIPVLTALSVFVRDFMKI